VIVETTSFLRRASRIFIKSVVSPMNRNAAKTADQSAKPKAADRLVAAAVVVAREIFRAVAVVVAAATDRNSRPFARVAEQTSMRHSNPNQVVRYFAANVSPHRNLQARAAELPQRIYRIDGSQLVYVSHTC
jgi:hypothetical protein